MIAHFYKPAHTGLRQENQDFEASLVDIVRACLKKCLQKKNKLPDCFWLGTETLGHMGILARGLSEEACFLDGALARGGCAGDGAHHSKQQKRKAQGTGNSAHTSGWGGRRWVKRQKGLPASPLSSVSPSPCLSDDDDF